jgi:hypothetical protein
VYIGNKYVRVGLYSAFEKMALKFSINIIIYGILGRDQQTGNSTEDAGNCRTNLIQT